MIHFIFELIDDFSSFCLINEVAQIKFSISLNWIQKVKTKQRSKKNSRNAAINFVLFYKFLVFRWNINFFMDIVCGDVIVEALNENCANHLVTELTKPAFHIFKGLTKFQWKKKETHSSV